MSPQSEKSPGLRLPQPSTESAGLSAPSRFEFPGSPETNIGIAEGQPQPVAPSPAAIPMPQMQSTPAQQATTSPPQDNAAADEDNTLLDEEWVNKAKLIVEQTRNDPFMQSHQISKVKADYLRTRHHKEIKVVDQLK